MEKAEATPTARRVTVRSCKLARTLAAETSQRIGRTPPAISQEALALLVGYRWPGNVRELRNVVERLMLLSEDGHVDGHAVEGALPAAVGGSGVSTGTLAERVESFEREFQAGGRLHQRKPRVHRALEAVQLARRHERARARESRRDLPSVDAGLDELV